MNGKIFRMFTPMHRIITGVLLSFIFDQHKLPRCKASEKDPFNALEVLKVAANRF